MSAVPRHDLDMTRFSVDPYPDLKELRSRAAIAFNRCIVRKAADRRTCDIASVNVIGVHK
ncbi:hypothetical protein [Bradyrhizobium yuanmingense]|uniref:hypothetical protein n=1 Tax=Bradyrhizobium yuanmingense TaxID=108015 RepID=UPI0012FDFB91|nr:hypothetical protein [Bradyrhizobium yuanmingense]